MSYSVGGKNLPANVKKLPAAKQRQWVHVFNSALERYDDESKAFAMANAVIKRQKAVSVFTGPDDPDLPAHVKALPSNTRRSWCYSHNYCAQDMNDPEGAVDYADRSTHMSVRDHVTMVGSKRKKAADDADADLDAEVDEILETLPDADADESESQLTIKAEKSVTPIKLSAVVNNFGLLERFKSWFGSAPTLPVSPWLFFKDTDTGRIRVVAFYSNNFEDKHGEIITDAAHKEYVEWADRTGNYPEFHYWHCGPGSRWAKADFVDYVDNIAMASGLVDEGKEHIAEALQKEQDKHKVSHGFFGAKAADRSYLIFRPFEISPLPAGKEANVWTACSLFSKEFEVPFSDAKKSALKGLGFDDAAIAGMEQGVKDLQAQAKAAGVEYKEAEGDGEQNANAVILGSIQELTGVVTSLAKSVADLTTTVTEVKAKQKEYDDNIAAGVDTALTARVAKAMDGGVHKPTASDGKEITKEEATTLGAKPGDHPMAWLFGANGVVKSHLGEIGLAGRELTPDDISKIGAGE